MARFDLVSRWYDLLPVPTHPDAVARALEGHTGPVVDLGGGTGRFTVRLTPEDADAIIVDTSRGMLGRALSARRVLHSVQASAAAIPLKDGAAGAVVATEAFHHFGDGQEVVLAEAARVLRPGGVLAIEEVDPRRPRGRLMALGERLLRYGSIFHPPQELQVLAQRHFTDVTVSPTGPATYLLTARGVRRP